MKYGNGKIIVSDCELCASVALGSDIDTRQPAKAPDFPSFGGRISADITCSGVTFSLSVAE